MLCARMGDDRSAVNLLRMSLERMPLEERFEEAAELIKCAQHVLDDALALHVGLSADVRVEGTVARVRERAVSHRRRRHLRRRRRAGALGGVDARLPGHAVRVGVLPLLVVEEIFHQFELRSRLGRLLQVTLHGSGRGDGRLQPHECRAEAGRRPPARAGRRHAPRLL